jgi:anaerobic magnesium-protoporphyrin IX monomethyl ester cyclase
MNILLINPSYDSVYKGTRIKEGVPYSPVLSLSTIATPLIKDGHKVSIIDSNIFTNPNTVILEKIKQFAPHYIGITFTTPLYEEMIKITQLAKNLDKNIILVGGGAHISSFPEETLRNSLLDIAVRGEGDFTLSEIISGKSKKEIYGISYKEGTNITSNPPREYIKDLDILPYPAWNLYDLKKYKTTNLLAKENPAGWLETSRGCVYKCPYCNKSIFGRTFRTKSAKRVLAEIEYMLNLGFKEIHIADDCFTTDIKRANDICDEIIKRKLKFPWATPTGIRVDRITEELLKKMAQAGCYRVFYGIESGSQRILNNINKGISLDQIRNAVRISNKVGMETYGYFMIGLPGETEEDMKKTLEFAKSLNLTMAKMSITIPIPGSVLFDEWNKKGVIKIKDWSKFNFYSTTKDIFDHPNLTWDIIEKYYKKFYIGFYFRPSFIIKRLFKSLKQGNVFSDIKHLLSTRW